MEKFHINGTNGTEVLNNNSATEKEKSVILKRRNACLKKAIKKWCVGWSKFEDDNVFEEFKSIVRNELEFTCADCEVYLYTDYIDELETVTDIVNWLEEMLNQVGSLVYDLRKDFKSVINIEEKISDNAA